MPLSAQFIGIIVALNSLQPYLFGTFLAVPPLEQGRNPRLLCEDYDTYSSTPLPLV
jgi:hypothetical protein